MESDRSIPPAPARPRRSVARRLVLSLLLVTGLVVAAFFALDGASYWTDEPEACLKCHVMAPQHESWRASTHAFVAVCNDCHTPADPLGKATTKVRSGIAHVFAYTTGRYEDEIRIAPASAAIARAACERCHPAETGSMGHGGVPREERDCLECHWSEGHADSRSLF